MIGLRLVEPPDQTDNRGRILEVAAALFSERGYASTTMRAIAGAMGMKAPALYWYFSNKQAILQALLHETMLDFTLALEAQVVGPRPDDKVRQYVRTYVRKAAELPASMSSEPPFGIRQMMQHLPPEGQARLIADQRRHLDILREALRDGIAAGCFRELDVNATAFAILAQCEHVRWWWRVDGLRSVDDLADEHGDLVMRMVRADS